MTVSSSLGNLFPDNKKRQYLRAEIRRGLVIRARLESTNPPKVKIFVVVGYDPDFHRIKIVLINSSMTELQRQKPYLKNRMIMIEPSRVVSFIEHPSYIDCTEIHNKNFDEFYNNLFSDLSQIKGHLPKELLNNVLSQISKAYTVKNKDKKIIQSDFSPVFPD